MLAQLSFAANVLRCAANVDVHAGSDAGALIAWHWLRLWGPRTVVAVIVVVVFRHTKNNKMKCKQNKIQLEHSDISFESCPASPHAPSSLLPFPLCAKFCGPTTISTCAAVVACYCHYRICKNWIVYFSLWFYKLFLICFCFILFAVEKISRCWQKCRQFDGNNSDKRQQQCSDSSSVGGHRR